MELKIGKSDTHTVLQYFTSEQRAAGYTGQCLISINRLTEIHMEQSALIAQLSIKKARLEAI